jgi:uncharacterized protein (DUF2267 family)
VGGDIPLHFLKVVEFEALSKPHLIFLQLLFDHMLDTEVEVL